MANEGFNRYLKRVICIDCGAIRWVRTNNVNVVKRCILCQYKHKQQYNSTYVKKHREQSK